jgi:protein involved in polysaccharide export with SLBB domain/capsular polysaccharide biosynthesis protein
VRADVHHASHLTISLQRMNDTTASDQHAPAPAPAVPFDTWAVLDFWSRRWAWVTWWTILFAVAGGYVAYLIFSKSYTSSAQLIHYEPTAVDAYRPRDISTPSLVVMLQSAALYEKVGAQLRPPLSAKELSRRLELTLDRNNDVVMVTAHGDDRAATARLVNQFSDTAINYTQTLQKQEAVEAGDYVSRQLAQVETELHTERAAIPPASTGVVAAITEPDELAPIASDLPQRVQSARDQLNELLVRYTEAHPLVREQQARLAGLEDLQRRSAATAARAPGKSRASAPVMSQAIYGRITPEEVAMGERLRALENNRALLISRQRAIQPFRETPPGYFRTLMPATPSRTLEHRHRLEIGLFAILGAFVGLMGSAGQILLSEFLDNRVKTRADVRRVTGLPLLATLGNFKHLSPAACDHWAFRAWTALQSRLSLSPNHGMVCGITSAGFGDGRSTWVDLLARAASGCGFRVLKITVEPPPEMIAEVARQHKTDKSRKSSKSTDTSLVPVVKDPTQETVSLTASVLASPGDIVSRLSAADAPPMVSIPLPGWVWNLERRKQWLSALEAWRAIENVVIFIELPPAAVSETVLLAENIPNLLWLVDAGKTDAADMHSELVTLREARCNLVGAVLNRERSMPVRGRFSRWLGSSAFLFFLIGLGLSFPGQPVSAAVVEAAEPAVQSATPTAPSTFSVVTPAQRVAWQQKLTLGPGDVLGFHIFGAPELSREEVPVGPDGRVSYLEAENILAAGLTVDELRDRLNEELGKFRRSPQAFVTPLAYRSKKYYMMGTVVQKGVFLLDRPITIIEAVARSRGFETGLSGGNMVETTDFSRCFITREGKHLPVDFEKLFLHGDLSQNVALEPNDYLYFPAAGSSAVYVLGEVRQPGAVPYNNQANVIAAIAARGGFTERAWRQRVLVVRGSQDHPETFRVNVDGAFTGEAGTFGNIELKPGDIVYIGNRPWVRAEELLDRAASAFVEAAVVSWTGIHLGPKTSSTSVSVP